MRIAKGRIEFKVPKIPRLFPEQVYAVTVWPFIFYEPHVWDDVCVQVHERYHWLDQIRVASGSLVRRIPRAEAVLWRR